MARTMTVVGICGVFFVVCFAVSSGTNCVLEDVDGVELRKLANANNELAFNLHRSLVLGTSANVFFSPLSISAAFGMLFYGARGETAEELRKALGYEKAQLLNEFVHNAFTRYFSDVFENGDSSNGTALNFANAILADKSVGLLDEYKRNIKELYKADARNVDFSKAPEMAEEINDWIRKKTNGKIRKCFDELSPATVLVLLNAVYFKGTWKTPFDPKYTKNGVFYNDGLESKAKSVPMMRIEAEFPVAFFEDFKALELPYDGGNVTMLILLPNKREGLEALEDSLTPEKLDKIQERMDYFNMKIALPKFKLEFEEELSEPLLTLGVNRIFHAEADLSGMTPTGGAHVSQILHKAVIEVNEEGSEAAALTEVIMFKSGSFVLRVNHPFLFAIMEKGSKSNLVLFLGRVNKL